MEHADVVPMEVGAQGQRGVGAEAMETDCAAADDVEATETEGAAGAGVEVVEAEGAAAEGVEPIEVGGAVLEGVQGPGGAAGSVGVREAEARKEGEAAGARADDDGGAGGWGESDGGAVEVAAEA
eukprot:5855482-Prymnesium_polylepis.1